MGSRRKWQPGSFLEMMRFIQNTVDKYLSFSLHVGRNRLYHYHRCRRRRRFQKRVLHVLHTYKY